MGVMATTISPPSDYIESCIKPIAPQWNFMGRLFTWHDYTGEISLDDFRPHAGRFEDDPTELRYFTVVSDETGVIRHFRRVDSTALDSMLFESEEDSSISIVITKRPDQGWTTWEF